jgi:hypothetical protein
MSQEKTVVAHGGIGFCGLLFIVLLCLKVGVVPTQVVGWSWWWVTAPLWAPPAAILAIVAAALLVLTAVATVVYIVSAIKSR